MPNKRTINCKTVCHVVCCSCAVHLLTFLPQFLLSAWTVWWRVMRSIRLDTAVNWMDKCFFIYLFTFSFSSNIIKLGLFWRYPHSQWNWIWMGLFALSVAGQSLREMIGDFVRLFRAATWFVFKCASKSCNLTLLNTQLGLFPKTKSSGRKNCEEMWRKIKSFEDFD